jgi:monoamine oxidase
MTYNRRSFLIGAGSGLSLLALAACTSTNSPPTPSVLPSSAPRNRVPRPTSFARSNWSKDQFARGSVSFINAGSTPKHRQALAKPVSNRVFFAGEATAHADPGTVAGARDSGLRAAAEVATYALPGERIAVIGAGIAGAEAARRLSFFGFDVTLIEARNRTGGRIHTVLSSDDDEWAVPPELGAWLLRDASDAELAADLRAVGVASALVGSVEYRSIDGTVVAPPTDAETTGFYGIDPISGESKRVVTGPFANIVSEALDGIDPYLSTTVTRIGYDNDNVSLRLGTGESLTVDRVVVTVPIGVLRTEGIEFDPPLPESHRSAIAAIGMGTVDTVWLSFDEPFWSTTAMAWSIRGAENGVTTWLNLEPVTGDAILVGLVAGASALALAEASDDEFLEAALTALAPFAD